MWKVKRIKPKERDVKNVQNQEWWSRQRWKERVYSLKGDSKLPKDCVFVCKWIMYSNSVDDFCSCYRHTCFSDVCWGPVLTCSVVTAVNSAVISLLAGPVPVWGPPLAPPVPAGTAPGPRPGGRGWVSEMQHLRRAAGEAGLHRRQRGGRAERFGEIIKLWLFWPILRLRFNIILLIMFLMFCIIHKKAINHSVV